MEKMKEVKVKRKEKWTIPVIMKRGVGLLKVEHKTVDSQTITESTLGQGHEISLANGKVGLFIAQDNNQPNTYTLGY
jgi:hypothetical protein